MEVFLFSIVVTTIKYLCILFLMLCSFLYFIKVVWNAIGPVGFGFSQVTFKDVWVTFWVIIRVIYIRVSGQVKQWQDNGAKSLPQKKKD
jgi:hypothetical protein